MKFIQASVSIAIAQAAGIVGSVFTVSSVATWYSELVKPEWQPPNWVFGPVWILLYMLMGFAAWIVWMKRDKRLANLALILYGLQLALNTLWSILFFGLQNPALAFAEILVLWVFIVATTALFWRIDKKAGALLVPYLAWVSFATYLNYTIWQLN